MADPILCWIAGHFDVVCNEIENELSRALAARSVNFVKLLGLPLDIFSN